MDAPPIMSPGVFAGRYAIETALGHGATSTVYRARDARTDRPVAVKILRRDLAEALGAGSFLREIKLMEALHHPRILPILDSGESEGRLYFVAPYMDGGTLRARLNRESQLPLLNAVQITCTIAEALTHAHAQGFIHRDVKPENILFAAGEACLADFGIARAVERSIGETSTSTGIARGTPAYMSPEQASGEHDYDGRSDIYSLACVLYEMVTGMRPFLGPSAQAVISQRFLHPPRPLSVYRPNVPAKLQAVINRAMQVSAADRYQTAAELARELRSIPESEFEKSQRKSIPVHRRYAVRVSKLALAGGALVVAAGLAVTGKLAFSHFRPGMASPPDTTRVALFPLEGGSQRTSEWHDDDLVRQAISRWRGLNVLDQFQMADAIRRVGSIESTNQAENVARSLGAGRYVRGRLTAGGDGWHVYVAIYQIGAPRALYTAESTLSSDFRSLAVTYERLVDSLLFRGANTGPELESTVGTRSLPAVQAFGRAQTALDRWDLAAADSAFQAAASFDLDYARASLWMAQVKAWREQSPSTWSAPAERALALAGQLNERERSLAEALVNLSRGDYGKACDVYARLRHHNDRDFAAWFGSAQCRMMDNIVVPDKASPSGWRFRSSVARAMEAYAKAFAILPSVHRGYERGAFEKLRSLLLLSRDITYGYRETDSAAFYGRIGMIGDSLVMVAYPWQLLFSGDPSSIPAGFHEALARRRADFLRIAGGWSAAFPRNAGAKYAVAVALELLGDASSIDTIRLARALEPDSIKRTRLAAAQVILLAKFGAPDELSRLASARALADSLLSPGATVSPLEAEALAPVAALTGRCSIVDSLVRNAAIAAGYSAVPASLLGAANVLATRLAIGCPVTTAAMHAAARDIERAVGKAPPEQHQRLEQILLYRPVVLDPRMDILATEHLAASTTDDLLLAARSIARGNKAGAAESLRAVALRADPGTPTPDITLARARMWLAVGDTATALRTLDVALNAIVSFGADDLSDPTNAGALVGMMTLRGELASARSDGSAARRWGDAARTLKSSSIN